MTLVEPRVVAVDLGASSGRVYAADFGPGRFHLSETGRFVNGGVRVGARLYWDILGLYRGMLSGLAAAAHGSAVESVGIDSWAVDYGLLRADGTMLDNPLHHRDRRTDAAYGRIVGAVGAGELFGRTGIALQPFNTLYQLAADRDSGRLDGAASVLLIPDLLAYFLTGEAGAEVTNASTTQLLGVSGRWDPELLDMAGARPSLVPGLRRPGDPAGEVSSSVLGELGVTGRVAVTAVASHDTASAVVAVPTGQPDFAYISCGTWSLVGVELDEPVLGDEARQAGFTNERGIDGTFRFLRNVMGLWLLQESVRAWERHGSPVDLAELNAAAAQVPLLRSVVDPDDAVFLPLGDMPARIAEACRVTGQPVPVSPAEVTRCILDSLALAYRRSVGAARHLAGLRVPAIHLVGGGVNNRGLCQLTADACGVPVVAGPVEAAAVGNAMVQARSLGILDGDRWALRRFVAEHVALDRYQPDPAITERFALAEQQFAIKGRVSQPE